MVKCKFNQHECFVKLHHYENNRPSIQLYDLEDGCPIARATVNLPNEDLQPGEVIIKDYSENTGMYQALLDSNVILPSHRKIHTGFVECPVSYIAPQL